MAKPMMVSEAYENLVASALSGLSVPLQQRAAKHYRRPPNELAKYIVNDYAEKWMRAGQKYMGADPAELVREILEVDRRELPEYAIELAKGGDIENGVKGANDLAFSAIYHALLTRRGDLAKIFVAVSPTAETWWTMAPSDFDGFSTLRTGVVEDIPLTLYTDPIRYYEVKIEPRDVEWQTHRYSSGGFSSMNEIGKQERVNYIEEQTVSKSAEDALSKEWPKLIDKMKSLHVVQETGRYDSNKTWYTVSASPEDIIAARAFVDKFRDAVSPLLAQIKGYSSYQRMLDELWSKLQYEVKEASYKKKKADEQTEIDEYNRRVFQQAYKIAEDWMRANDIDTVTPYFSEQVRMVVDRWHGTTATRGPYYAALRYPAVMLNDATDKVYPAIGELPIFGEYPHADYFADATDAILTSPHEHDAEAVEWMRKNMKLFANGRTTEVIVMPSVKAYTVKTDDRKSSGFMAMTGATAHTTLSGAAKAAATRAMAAGKAVTFSFSPRGIDRPTYPEALAGNICATHLVHDWKGQPAKWKLAK